MKTIGLLTFVTLLVACGGPPEERVASLGDTLHGKSRHHHRYHQRQHDRDDDGLVLASSEENDDLNCGASNYACLNGRTCVERRCLPAWQPLETEGAPTPRFAAAATVVRPEMAADQYNGQYIISGGCTSFDSNTPASTDAAIFDPNTNTWTATEAMNEGRAQHGAITLFGDHHPLVFGGISTCGDLDSVGPEFEHYDDDTWEVLDLGENAPTPRYNTTLVNSDYAGISVFGGGTSASTTATADFFRGNPHTTDAWTASTCTLGNCARNSTVGFYDDNMIRILGDGAFPWMTVNLEDNSWDFWDEPYDQNNGGDTSPQFADYASDRDQLRAADSSLRIFMFKSDVSAIYSRDTGHWEIDDIEPPPQDFCNDAPPVWIPYGTGSAGEVFAFSGGCGSTIATGGWRYQPPAPNMELHPNHGPALVSVPGGTATLGESSNLRTVTFPNDYYIDETEVTVAQYAECVSAEVCTEPQTDQHCNWGVEGNEAHPVNCVDVEQAEEFCEWAGKRLPTQQEWERAARYNDNRTYPWGSSSAGYATKENTNSGDSYPYTSPVGSFPAGNSALGLKDMAGNVWEITQSPPCFNERGACTNCPLEDGPCENACDVCESDDSTVKGGAYSHAVSYSRSAYRTYIDENTQNPIFGFRCVRTGEPH